ncbi:uncharacterized protein BP5553_08834 [Venustampulla echinocandica]|uniref:Chitin-binding type-2 domain-containing protein n=1 Tax=Venustampulla echinocandica TaxID=2656787 RepID=A0A370TD29_9HELO|nr:uncharacterized protein BP5553_08834 [Venustampulla echinocandica]RDL32378.1 hypothetical protein BP5553_08834 [Venustampulla echinocandica]
MALSTLASSLILLLALPFTTCTPTNVRLTLDVSLNLPDVVTTAGFVCENEGFFGDLCDCTKFHRCVIYDWTKPKEFTRFDFSCGEGTEFDEALSVCNHPWAISPPPVCHTGPWDGCPNHPKADPETFTTTDTLTKTGPQALVGHHQRKGNKNYSTAFSCTTDGMFPDASDCNKYHECSLNSDGSWKHDIDFCGKTQQFCAPLGACGPAEGCPVPCGSSNEHLKDRELK